MMRGGSWPVAGITTSVELRSTLAGCVAGCGLISLERLHDAAHSASRFRPCWTSVAIAERSSSMRQRALGGESRQRPPYLPHRPSDAQRYGSHNGEGLVTMTPAAKSID